LFRANTAPSTSARATAECEPWFDQQLDIDGNLRDIAPEHERLRLFEPDVQLPGQTRPELAYEECAELEPSSSLR
jgi:hypothetical protein